jgi:hypothetical protein
MTRKVVIAAVVAVALVLFAAWVLVIPLERATALAPVIVFAAAALIGLGIFWTRVAAQQVRELEHPRRAVGIALGLVVLLIGLTVLGINLPKE